MKDYRLNWLRDVIKKLLKNVKEKSTYPSPNADDSLFSVELIIDPVISIFEDYKGILSMAINLGYNYYYSDIISEKRLELHTKLDGDILVNIITLISSEYKGKFFAFGFCDDSSYVAFNKKRLMKSMLGNLYFQHVIGDMKNVTDIYLWMDSLISKPIDSSIIYSMFPKDKITLSDTKKLKIEEEKLTQLNQLKHEDEIKEKNNIETLKKEMLLKAKKLLKEGKSIKNLLISGEGGVGKTSLIIRYVLNKFYSGITMTNCVDIFQQNIPINNEEVSLFIWDLMGQERARFLVKFFANNIDGAMFCFDLTRLMTLENIEEWINYIRKSNPDIPIIFVGIKTDFIEDIQVDDEYALSLMDDLNLFEYIKVSSKTGENVNEAFTKIIDKIKQNPTLDQANIRWNQKKFKLLEYLKSYKIKGKEELKKYFGKNYNDDLLKEDWKPSDLLLYSEFREKILQFIDNL